MSTYKKLGKGKKAAEEKAKKAADEKAKKVAAKKAAGKKAAATEVAKTETTAVSKLPDWLEEPEDGDIGMEVEPDDISTPLIKLVQPGSREAAKGEIQAGHYLNLKTGEDLGDTVVFVPLKRNMKRIFWQPVDDGGGINCRSYDGKVGSVYGSCAQCKNDETGIRRMDFGANNAPPECTKYADYPCIILGNVAIDENDIVQLEGKLAEEPVGVVSFARSSFKAGKDLAQSVIEKRLKIFANVFAVSSKFMEGQSNSYFVSETEWIGWTPEPIYTRIKDAWAELMMIVGSPELYTPDTDHMAEESIVEDTADVQESGAGVEAEIVEPEESVADTGEANATGPGDDLPF